MRKRNAGTTKEVAAGWRVAARGQPSEAKPELLQQSGRQRFPLSTASSSEPGIDDGGEALELAAQERAPVPSDGRPYWAMLHPFESGARLDDKRARGPKGLPSSLVVLAVASVGGTWASSTYQV